MQGSVSKVNLEKGYGFISPDGGGRDVFFHASKLLNKQIGELTRGSRVTFEVEEGEKGPKALRVQVTT